MKYILICYLLSVLSIGQASAENLMIFIQCGNKELSYHAELKQAGHCRSTCLECKTVLSECKVSNFIYQRS